MKITKPERLIHQRKVLLTQQILAAIQSKGGMGLYGPTGCGKTNIVRKILTENGIPFTYYALHNSPLQVFEALYQNRNKVIVIDDTSHNKNPLVQALFKAALAADPATGKKTLRINISESTKKREGISELEFEFDGVLILISNHYDASSSAHAEAIDSRLHTYLMELSFSEKLYLINQFSRQPEKYGMTSEQMHPLISYLNKHLHPGCTKFDLRLFEKATALVKAAPFEWEIGVNQLLEVDPRFSIICTIIEEAHILICAGALESMTTVRQLITARAMKYAEQLHTFWKNLVTPISRQSKKSRNPVKFQCTQMTTSNK
jgi:hypothetical protein